MLKGKTNETQRRSCVDSDEIVAQTRKPSRFAEVSVSLKISQNPFPSINSISRRVYLLADIRLIAEYVFCVDDGRQLQSSAERGTSVARVE